MTQPISLRSVRREPCEEVVALLRDLLAMAERGELVSISYAGEMAAHGDTSHGIVTGRSQLQNVANHVWALEQIKFRILHEIEDEE